MGKGSEDDRSGRSASSRQGRGGAGRGGVAFLRHPVARRWEHLSMRGLRRMRGAVSMRIRVPTEPSRSQISEEGGSMCAVLPGRSECAIGSYRSPRMALSGEFSGGEVGSDMHCELEFCHVLDLSLSPMNAPVLYNSTQIGGRSCFKIRLDC